MKGAPCPVSSNIQHYLAQATLPRLRLAPCTPRMPVGHHKTHRNNLCVRPERYRRLRNIHRIKREFLDAHCFNFIEKHIPSQPVYVDEADPDSDEQPSIPCQGFSIEGFGPRPIRHIDSLRVSWLEDNVLRTVQSVLRMIPEYRDIVANYSFTCNDIMRDEDQQIFRYFMWERTVDTDADDKPVKFILAYQPPWILAPRDIELFADKGLRNLPSYEACEGSGQVRYNSSHKIWAKLWDVCKMHNCSSFILTNYSQWVFGGFSKGWENGYTMGVVQAYPPDPKDAPKPNPKGKDPLSRTPTLLEYLTYWTVSSMRLPDYFEVPPVPEEIDLDMAIDDSDSLDIPTLHAIRAQALFHARPGQDDAEPSESDWNNSEVPSSAGVRIGPESHSGMTLPRFLSDTWGLPPEHVKARQVAKNVNSWIDKGSAVPPSPTMSALPVSPIARPVSPVWSEWSDKSLATRRPYRSQGFLNHNAVIEEEVYEYEFTGMDTT